MLRTLSLAAFNMYIFQKFSENFMLLPIVILEILQSLKSTSEISISFQVETTEVKNF